MSVRAALVLAVASSIVASDARAWTRRIAGTWNAGPIAVDARGDVLAAIPVRTGRNSSTTAIVKLGARTGEERWRRSLAAPGREHSDEVTALLVVLDGDVVAAGGAQADGPLGFTVVRLDGRNGRRRWRHVVRGAGRQFSYEEALSAALDPRGDVVAAGFVESEVALQYHGTNDFAVVKLGGDGGEERWRFVLDGSAQQGDSAAHVAVDGSGDVFAAGTVQDLEPTPIGYRPVPVLVKLSGSDGHLVWRQDLDVIDVRSMTLDASGDVLVAGTFGGPTPGDDFGVAKLDGTTGALRWSRTLGAAVGTWESAFAITALASGDVAATGFTGDLQRAHALLTVGVWDGGTGVERWHRMITGTLGSGIGRALALDEQGEVVVGAQVLNLRSCYDVAVDWLAPTTGEMVATRTIDGRTQATKCERTDCGDFGRCPPSRAGADQDDVSAIAIDPSGRVVVGGALSDGVFGRQHGFVASLPRR